MKEKIFFYDYFNKKTGETGSGIIWAENGLQAAIKITKELNLSILASEINICSTEYIKKINNGHIIIN